MFDLTGRVALVTGGGQNVGAGIARVAAQGAAFAVDLLFDNAGTGGPTEQMQELDRPIRALDGRTLLKV